MTRSSPGNAPSRRKSPQVGVRDVAVLAGVSTQTVSRVLNGSAHVRDETRDRVTAAIEQLKYHPNNAARALGTTRTRTLGVVATDVTLYGPNIAIAALATATRETGLWLATSYADSRDVGSVRASARHLITQGVDGLVLVAPHIGTEAALRDLTVDSPIVSMHAGVPDRQAQGVEAVVDHLVALGHRRLARLAGPPDWQEERSRQAGFDSALARHGLVPVAIWTGDWTAQSGASAAASVLRATRRRRGPTAVVAGNDQMALGLMNQLQRMGLNLPSDLSVVGFDDNPDAAHYNPPLTTVRLDMAGEARRCVAEVFSPEQAQAPALPELVDRASASSFSPID